jgi:uncharacterized protein (DUF1800 family)
MQQQQKHLLWRAGFGPDWQAQSGSAKYTVNTLVDGLFADSGTAVEMLKGTDAVLKDLNTRVGPATELSKEEKMQLRALIRDGFKKLNVLWLNEMAGSKAQLREKMALFWHGHFACRINNIFFAQELLHIIRRNALGNFGDLLREVSKSPAMLSFLNNQQNRKRHPNENFARELLELFTLGRGQYDENDIKEAARAFTGWGFDRTGNFVFRVGLHDDGIKTFMGKKGNFDGDDIIQIILQNRNTAIWITDKIVKFLLGNSIEKKQLESLAEIFYQSGLEISVLLRSILTADWFYDSQYYGIKIKSPVEWIVGIRRTFPMEEDKNEWQLIMQKLLGQVLFFPPNVAGWPGGTNWIDSSTLMYRLRWPMLLLQNYVIDALPRQDDDDEMGKEKDQQSSPNRLKAIVDWEKYNSNFQSVPSKDWLISSLNHLLVTDKFDTGPLEKYATTHATGLSLKIIAVHLMSTPEYQLC